MKVTVHKRKTRWHSPQITISGISRETLSLILTHAQENLQREIDYEKKVNRRSGMNHEGLLNNVKQIEEYINNEDTVVHLTPLYVS